MRLPPPPAAAAAPAAAPRSRTLAGPEAAAARAAPEPDAGGGHREQIRRFVDREVGPRLGGGEPDSPALRAVVAAAVNDGLLRLGSGPAAPNDELWPHVALAEEVSRVAPASFTLSFAAHALMVLPLLHCHGDEEIEKQFLQPGRSGEAVFSRSLRGDDGDGPVVRRRGDRCVLDGTSAFAANASVADAHCVLASVADESGPPRAAFLMVPVGLPGIDVEPLTGGVGHVRFRHVPVPEWCFVGGLDEAVSWDEQERRERLVAACCATAAAGRYLHVAADYSRRRVAFGTRLQGHQAVRLRLAELRMRVEGSRCLNHAAVKAAAAGDDDGDCLSAAAATKAALVVTGAAEACMGLHGARGYTGSHEASAFVLDARLLSTVSIPDPERRGARAVAGPAVGITSAQGGFRGAVRAIVEAEVAPRLPTWSSEERFPVREVLACLGGTGSLGAGFPASHGGTGGDLWQSVVLHEELAALGSSALATVVLSHVEVGTRLVAEHATPATAGRWVPTALRGDALLGYAATEAEAGSDLAATTTAAAKDGDGWVLHGHKTYITNAEQADGLCVLARTGERAVTSHTLFLVPMSSAGVSSGPLRSLGNRGTLGEVWFDGVRVGRDAVLGLEGQGLMLQIRRLAHERAFVAVSLVAMATTLLGQLPDTPGQAIDGAHLEADIAEARALAYHAIAAVAAGQDARGPAAMAKLCAGRVLRRVTAYAVQLGATTALAQDSSTGQAYLDALGFAFAGGTDNMLLEAIAR